MQLVKEYLATVISAYWATVNLSWHKEWNKCIWANLHLKKKKKHRQEMNSWTFFPNPCKRGKSHHYHHHQSSQYTFNSNFGAVSGHTDTCWSPATGHWNGNHCDFLPPQIPHQVASYPSWPTVIYRSQESSLMTHQLLRRPPSICRYTGDQRCAVLESLRHWILSGCNIMKSSRKQNWRDSLPVPVERRIQLGTTMRRQIWKNTVRRMHEV